MVRRRTAAPVVAAMVAALVLVVATACGSGGAGPGEVDAGAAIGGRAPAAPRPLTGATPAPMPTPAPTTPPPMAAVVPERMAAAATVPGTASAAAAPAPDSVADLAAARIPGIDVSKWQPAIDWPRVRAAGYRFAYVSAVGSYGVNPHFGAQWNGASAAGLYRGAYFFGDPTTGTGVGDADRLLTMAGDMRDGATLPPMLDVERHHDRPACNGVSPTVWASYIRTFLAEVTARVGVTPIVYTAAHFWQTCLGDSTEFSHTALFAAQPRVASPEPFAGWPRVMFWQHTVGRVPGIAAATDQDTFLGGLTDLRALLIPRR